MGDPLSLVHYAELRAEMDAGDLRDDVLMRAGLSVDEWIAAQMEWLEKMGAELERGRFELTNGYSRAFLDRQQVLSAARKSETKPAPEPAPSEPAPAPISSPPLPAPPPPLPYEPMMPSFHAAELPLQTVFQTDANSPDLEKLRKSPPPKIITGSIEIGAPDRPVLPFMPAAPRVDSTPALPSSPPPLPSTGIPGASPAKPPATSAKRFSPALMSTMVGVVLENGATLPFLVETGSSGSAPTQAGVGGTPFSAAPLSTTAGTPFGAGPASTRGTAGTPFSPAPSPTTTGTPFAAAPPTGAATVFSTAPSLPTTGTPFASAPSATPFAAGPASTRGTAGKPFGGGSGSTTGGAPTLAAPRHPSSGGPQAGVGGFTLEQHVSLCAEMAFNPTHVAETLARYRMTAEGKAEMDRLWKERFAADPALEAKWHEAYRVYTTFLGSQRR